MRLFPGRRSRWSAAISQICALMGKTTWREGEQEAEEVGAGAGGEVETGAGDGARSSHRRA